MRPEVESVFNTFSDPESIPYLPSVAIDLMAALANENSSLADLVELCRHDPSLAAKLLTMANAASSPGSMAVSRLDQAIGLLGRTRVATLCQTAALSLFAVHTQEYGKSTHFLEAFTCGLVAERLALSFCPEVSPELAYVGGSFCNIGKLLGAIVMPEMIDRVYVRANRFSDPLPWSAAEDLLGAPKHTILGEIACVLWGLHEDLVPVVAEHHQILTTSEGRPSALSKLVALVALANQLAHRVMLNSHRVDKAVLASCLSWFQISEGTLEDLVVDLRPAAEHSRRYLDSI